jgi:hypothetical protein
LSILERYIREAPERFSVLAGYLALSLFPYNFSTAQSLVRENSSSNCPPTHIRFTARAQDNVPAADLKPSDVRVWFGGAPANIVSLISGVSNKSSTPNTDILFVVAPFPRLNQDSIEKLIKNIVRADNFHFDTAVLAPDGKLSHFSSDPEELHAALLHTISGHLRRRTRSEWPPYEEAGFMALRKIPGRHVIVDLTDPANPYHSREKESFGEDHILEYLALFDMSQIYKLIDPVPTSASIPMGDASTVHVDIGPGNHSLEQMQEVANASETQSQIWSQTNTTGGRYDETLDALFEDILKDAPGSYDSIVQATTSCEPGRIYSVNVTSRVPGVRLFGPNSTQVIPVAISSH